MSSENIFLEDWYACLQAHLGYVVEKNDRSNEDSLIVVLKRIGVGDEEIEQVRTQTLTALGREVELLPDAETIPEVAVPSDLEASQAISVPPESANQAIAEPAAPEVDPTLPTDPPGEPRREPAPPPKPPKHSQMSLF